MIDRDLPTPKEFQTLLWFPSTKEDVTQRCDSGELILVEIKEYANGEIAYYFGEHYAYMYVIRKNEQGDPTDEFYRGRIG